MSKLLYIVPRDGDTQSLVEKITSVCDSLNPDNIVAKPTEVGYCDKVVYGLSNPNETLVREKTNIIFGQKFNGDADWKEPGDPKPDGNYAIFRSHVEGIEIITDILGTKAIWYLKNEKFFIASSSQRAIIKFIGSFEFNSDVIPWMVCNGLLGPGLSWDKRISLIPPDTALKLDFENWKLDISSEKIIFKPNNKTDKQNTILFKDTLDEVFKNMKFNYSLWKLTLSGGYDSRGLLFALPKKDSSNNQIETITWGVEGAELKSGNDAYIAKKIAHYLGVPHIYYKTNTSSTEPLSTVLKRFLKNGEGRIDHLGGYRDGFSIWKKLYESNVQGIIRGDEVFGSYNFASEFHLKKFIGLSLPSDYDNLKDLEYFQSLKFEFPDKFLKKNDEESQELWRDRLYQTYLVPTFLSALEDLKQPYLEQVNPLLSRKIVNLIRDMPDHLRTEKKLFKNYVNSFPHSFKYGKTPAIETMKDLFRQPELVIIVKKELNTSAARKLFDESFLNFIQSKMQIYSENYSAKNSFKGRIKELIPKEIKKFFLKRTFVPKADLNMVGFRLFMISRMVTLLANDAESVQ